ncbi:hypothetical protein [Enterobacter kobei]
MYWSTPDLKTINGEKYNIGLFMAGKKQTFDNRSFKNIAGNFSSYSDLTLDGKRIVNDIITKCAGKKGYPHKKVYYVLFNCWDVNTKNIKYFLHHYHYENHDPNNPTDSTVRKFLTITKQLSVAMVEANNKGVKLFKEAEEGKHYMNPVQKYQFDKMYDNGASLEEMIAELQRMIDVSTK